jgi:hypothetical protein
MMPEIPAGEPLMEYLTRDTDSYRIDDLNMTVEGEWTRMHIVNLTTGYWMQNKGREYFSELVQ